MNTRKCSQKCEIWANTRSVIYKDPNLPEQLELMLAMLHD